MNGFNRWFETAGASSELVSLDRFIDQFIFATQPGAFGGTFRVSGIDPECLSNEALASISTRLVQAMRLLPEDCSLYQILINRRGCELPASRYAESENEVVAETQRKRQAFLTTRALGAAELYSRLRCDCAPVWLFSESRNEPCFTTPRIDG